MRYLYGCGIRPQLIVDPVGEDCFVIHAVGFHTQLPWLKRIKEYDERMETIAFGLAHIFSRGVSKKELPKIASLGSI